MRYSSLSVATSFMLAVACQRECDKRKGTDGTEKESGVGEGEAGKSLVDVHEALTRLKPVVLEG